MRQVIAQRLAVLVCAAFLASPLGAAEDLRDRVGTASPAAAKALDEGIRLVQAKKPAEGLKSLETAIKEDPNLQLAYYWKALAQIDLGDVDEALATFRQIVGIAEKTEVNNVTIDGCVNAGLTLAKLQRDKESRLWFSKAIALDPTDKFRLHWKAYRNMAISCRSRGDHASAAMCAFAGYLADPQRVGARMVFDFLDKVDKEEVARVLAFDDPSPRVAARGIKSKVGDPVEVKGLPKGLSHLLVDAAANRLIVVGPREPKYYLVDCGKQNEVKAVDAPGEIVAASLAGGELYLSVRPSAIVKVAPATGKAGEKWTVPGGAPASLAALPGQGVVVFPGNGVLQVLDLDTGKIQETKFPGQFVAADPRQMFCFAFVREESGPSSGHVIINGRPVFFRSRHFDWSQTALYKYAVLQKRPMLAEMRLNAASNGRSIHVSPDGQWVAIPGGGGWRPKDNAGHGAGYGIAVFATADLGSVQGFFATDAYPEAVAVNPVTRQVAAIRSQDAKIYRLGEPKDPLLLPGPHGPLAAWSPDGRYLYISGKSGLRAWANTLSPEEEKIGINWWKEIKKPQRQPQADERAVVEAIEAYKTFQIKSDRKDTLAAIAQAQSEGRTRKPPEWLQYGPYQGDKELKEAFQPPLGPAGRDEGGLRIYRLKKLRETHAGHPGIAFLLGQTYYSSGQLDRSEKELLDAVHADQGRTNITVHALRGLRRIRERSGDHEAAAYCAAHVLRLDLASPQYLDEAKASFDRLKIGAAGEKLIERGRKIAVPAEPGRPGPGGKLPRLPIVEETQVYTAEKIFSKAAPSVVLVRAGRSSGSGVCVAEKGVILTNHHVVEDSPQTIRVYAYRHKDGKLERLPPMDAEILYESAEEDLAVLRVERPPETLVPLAVAAARPKPGAKVCAIGSPGLGPTVLEQSISEGIVSSPSRRLGGRAYIQHTAAVNPGNSGGPLLNERCQVQGIITSKTNLENVSFAIPAERIREIFEGSE